MPWFTHIYTENFALWPYLYRTFLTQTATAISYSAHRLVFLLEAHCVLCAYERDPWSLSVFRRLVTGISLRMSRFPVGSVHVRFVLNKLDTFFSEYFGFTLSVSFQKCSILDFIFQEEKQKKAENLPTKQSLADIRKHGEGKYFHI